LRNFKILNDRHQIETPDRLNQLERKIEKHDVEIKAIFEAIHQLMLPPEKPQRKIGLRA